MNIEKILKRNEQLEARNANWRNYHQDLADYCLPRKAWQTTIRNTGDRLNLGKIFDSTAIRALKIMSAGFHSNLTNPSSKWFDMQTRDTRLMEIRGVRLWFKEVVDIMNGVINSSNFDTTMQEFYTDSGCFGTGVVLTMEDLVDKVRYQCCPISGMNIEEDAQGRVNRVYYNYKFSVAQVLGMFGKNASQQVQEQADSKPNEQIDMLYYVGPRNVREEGKEDNLNMEYEAAWIEKKTKHLLREGGFFEFPYAVGRYYKDPTEVFGFSPAMDILPEIKLVNAMVRTMLRSAMKIADPPLMLPSRGFIVPLNLNPAALNYRDPKTSKDDLQQIPVSGNIPITREMVQDVQINIEKGFNVPLFRALSDVTKQMTVPEVQRRIAENMVLLGPVVGRHTDEVLDPTILRTFFILYRAGELPEAPAEIKGRELDVVYISPLARVQRESDIFAIESFLSDVAAIAQIKPGALDLVDEDVIVKNIARIKGIDPEIIRSDEQINALRQAKQQAAEAQQKLMMMQQGADVVKTGADANMSMASAGAMK